MNNKDSYDSVIWCGVRDSDFSNSKCAAPEGFAWFANISVGGRDHHRYLASLDHVVQDVAYGIRGDVLPELKAVYERIEVDE